MSIRSLFSLVLSFLTFMLSVIICSLSLSLRPNSASPRLSLSLFFPQISQKRHSKNVYSSTFYQIRGFLGELVLGIWLLGGTHALLFNAMMEAGGSRVMETELRASQVQTPVSHNHHNHHHHHRAVTHHTFREESGDEELSVLPRHTKVIVTGNNRTKSVLVGLQGVVKSVGLGGWHFLVLKNGEEVKLQRNALSVLEPPTGKEDDADCDNSFCSSSDRGDKDIDYTSLDYQKSTKPRIRHTRPPKRSRQKDPHSHSLKPQARIDLSKLGTAALWRYWKHFNLINFDANLTKEQLLHGVRHHFLSMQLDEMQVIMSFIQSARRVKVINSEAKGLLDDQII